MDHSQSVEYRQPKKNPYGWIFLMEFYALLFCTGIAFIIVPVYFAITRHPAWYAAGIAGSFAAVMIFRFVLRKVKKHLRLNNHLDQYEFTKDKIQYKQHRKIYGDPITGSIPLSSIEEIYYSDNCEIFTELPDGIKYEHLPLNYSRYPGFYIKYKNSLQTVGMVIPVYSTEQADPALSVIFNNNPDIKLYYTGYIAYVDDPVNEDNKENEENIPGYDDWTPDIYRLKYSGDITRDIDEALEASRKTKTDEKTGESLSDDLNEEDHLPSGNFNPNGYSLGKASAQSAVLMVASMYIYRILMKFNIMNDNNDWVPFFGSLFIAFLYFKWLKTPRWYHSFPFYIMLFFLYVVLAVIWEDNGSVSPEFSDVIVEVFVLQILCIYLPFLIVKALNNRNNKKETAQNTGENHSSD